jgi:hypothetical protein
MAVNPNQPVYTPAGSVRPQQPDPANQSVYTPAGSQQPQVQTPQPTGPSPWHQQGGLSAPNNPANKPQQPAPQPAAQAPPQAPQGQQPPSLSTGGQQAQPGKLGGALQKIGQGATNFMTGVGSRLIERAGSGMDEATGGATNVRGSIQSQAANMQQQAAQGAQQVQQGAQQAGAQITGAAQGAVQGAQQAVQGGAAQIPNIPPEILEALGNPEILAKVKEFLAELGIGGEEQGAAEPAGTEEAPAATGEAQPGQQPPSMSTGGQSSSPAKLGMGGKPFSTFGKEWSDANLKQVFIEPDPFDFEFDDLDIPVRRSF